MLTLQEIDQNFDEQFNEILGLETDPNGTKNVFLIRDEDDNILEGIEFSEEKELLKSFIRSQIQQLVKEMIPDNGEKDDLQAGFNACHSQLITNATNAGIKIE